MKKKNRQNDMENTRKHVRGTNSPSYGKDNSVREWEKSRDYENYRFSTKELALYLMQGSFLALGINYLFYKSIWAHLLAAKKAGKGAKKDFEFSV